MSWGEYVCAVLFIHLGGLGRPLVVNMAIDPNRLVVDQKASLIPSPETKYIE